MRQEIYWVEDVPTLRFQVSEISILTTENYT